jgi:hypothetical protein
MWPIANCAAIKFKPYCSKWAFTYRLQWALNDQALLDASKTDGLFPLVTNTDLAAAEVLRKYKTQLG